MPYFCFFFVPTDRTPVRVDNPIHPANVAPCSLLSPSPVLRPAQPHNPPTPPLTPRPDPLPPPLPTPAQVITQGASWRQLLYVAALISIVVCSLSFAALVLWTRGPQPPPTLTITPSVGPHGLPVTNMGSGRGPYAPVSMGRVQGVGREARGPEWEVGDVTDLSSTAGDWAGHGRPWAGRSSVREREPSPPSPPPPSQHVSAPALWRTHAHPLFCTRAHTCTLARGCTCPHMLAPTRRAESSAALPRRCAPPFHCCVCALRG